MKNFTDELVNLILENERTRIDKIMGEVTENISKDFELVVLRFLDLYYEDYDPRHYVRIHGVRGKYMQGKTPRRKGQVSLHAALARQNNKLRRSGGTLQWGQNQVSYVGGIAFDENNFKENSMRHLGKGISEWNIVENFVYAGDGVGKGDWRSQIDDYNIPSLDEAMGAYIDSYDPLLRRHYKNALNNALRLI